MPIMIRPPYEKIASIQGLIVCSCGTILATLEQSRQHWQIGHFDYLSKSEREAELETRLAAAEAWAAAWKQAAKRQRANAIYWKTRAQRINMKATDLADRLEGLVADAITHAKAAEQRAERLAGACQGLLEQVRHDNESEACHRAVAAGLGASEWKAFMPAAWQTGRAELAVHIGHEHMADNAEGD